MSYLVKNNAQATVNNAPGTGGTSIGCSDVSAFDTNYPIQLTIVKASTHRSTSESNEVVEVTSESGGIFTVTRNVDGRGAIDIASGDIIVQRVTADIINKRVVGPASATDNAFARFNADGYTVQNSQTTESDAGNVTVTGTIAASNLSGTNTGDEVAATTSVAGVVELATTAETTTGTDTARAVTPAALKNATHAFASSITASNLSGTNTGDEVAATDSVAGVVELATEVEVETGTDTSRAVTPAALQDADHAFSGDITFAGDISLTSTGCNKTWNAWAAPMNGMWIGTNNKPTEAFFYAANAGTVFSSNRREVQTLNCATGAISRTYGCILLPEDYDGSNLVARVYWASDNTNTGNVRWQLGHGVNDAGDDLTATGTYSSTTTIAAAPGTASVLVGTAITFTPTNGADAAGQMLFFDLLRNGTDGTDTHTGTAKIIGIKFYYA